MIADHSHRVEQKRLASEIMREVGLGGGSPGSSSDLLFIGLELSSHGRRFGPFAQSYLCEKLVQNRLVGYGQWLRDAADRVDVPADIRGLFLSDTAEGRRHWQSDLPAPVVNGIDAAVGAGCLGV